MTFKKLCDLVIENNIPVDVRLLSDSGWECGSTDMDGVYYNQSSNCIVFTQSATDATSIIEYDKIEEFRKLTRE